MSRNNKPKPNHKKPSQRLNIMAKNQSINAVLTVEKLTIKIKITSDWHIGSGMGIPGDIDSLVQKDKDGLPYIPAKSLTGIWRDACELVAFALDNGEEKGNWQKWVLYLFGEQPAIAEKVIDTKPLPAALSIRPAYFSQHLRAVLNSKPNLKNALTFVKPGISIDAESGCAKEDFLRFEEVVRGGAILEAQCQLNLPPTKEQQEVVYSLLIAGAKFVERLGGKRRRGTGKCQLLIEENIKPAINWIDYVAKYPEEPPILDVETETDTGSNQYLSNTENEEWVEVSLGITAKSPLIISKRTVGNVVETLDYIPGTHLLRLIVKKLSGLGVDLGSAIAHGDIILTNATIQVDNEQGRPVPSALFYEKLGGGLDKDGRVYNRLYEDEPKGQLKGYRSGYIGSTDGKNLPQYQAVKITVGTHNTIDDQHQRPTKDLGGGLYTYKAIQPGTKLQGKLKLRKPIAYVLDRNKPDWLESLNEDYRIGQSKKDDYGDINLTVITNQESKSHNPEIINDELTVWLLSDVLIRDERLRPTTDIKYLEEELETRLNVTLERKSCNDKKLSFISRTHRIDSWQVRWGLPRPSLVGLAAGTCAVFKVTGELNTELLTQIQSSGIGERRAEGYGQICFNDPILIKPTSKLKPPEKAKNNQPEDAASNANHYIEDNQEVINYAHILERAAWREIIHRASILLAADNDSRPEILDIKIENKESKPPMSQLGSLRSVLSRLKSPGDESVKQWIQDLQATKNRVDKWHKGSLDKLEQLITSPTEIWDHLSSALKKLGHKHGFSEFTLTKTGEEKLKAELWVEAVQILIDAFIRFYKRRLENQQ